MPLWELIVICIALIGLLMVIRFQNRKPSQPKGLFNTGLGLTVIIILNLGRILINTSLLSYQTNNEYILYINTFYVIGSIFGLLLILAGLIETHSTKKEKNNIKSNQSQKDELIKKTHQLCQVETRLKIISDKIIKDIVEIYGFTGGQIYARSFAENECYSVAAYTKNNKTAIPSVDDTAVIETLPIDGSDELEIYLINAAVQPGHIIPVRVLNKTTLFICLWHNNDQFIEKDDLNNLKIIAGIIGQKIELDANKLLSDFYRSVNQLSSNQKPIIGNSKKIEDRLGRIYNCLKELTPLDYMSLAIKNENANFQRVSLIGGNILNEKNVNMICDPYVTTYVYKNDTPVVINNLGTETDFTIELPIIKNDMTSMAAYPINYGQQKAVITFASKQKNVFKGYNQYLIEQALGLFEKVMTDHLQNETELIDNERREKLKRLALLSGLEKDATVVTKRAVDIIAEELRPSIVRFSEYTDEKSFITSRMLKTVIPYNKIMPADGTMILSLMPRHNQVINQMEKTLIDTDSKSEISEAEAVQVFGSAINSLLIFPVIVKNKVYGIFSLAEKRNISRYRFSTKDIEFVESIIEVVQGAHVRQMDIDEKRNEKISHRCTYQNKSELRSSLSGILGSVELLQDERIDGKLKEACFSILNRSAQKLNKTIMEN